MPSTKQEILIFIIAISLILIFLGFVFLFLIISIQKKKKKTAFEKEQMQRAFEEQMFKVQLEIQEQTFNAISAEIHDNVGQILSLATVQASIVENQLKHSQPLLADCKHNINRAMTDLRDIAKSLSSERIELLDLVKAVQLEADRLNRTKPAYCTVKVFNTIVDLNSKKKLLVFRIIQEAINNVLKHAQATSIEIILTYLDKNFTVSIQDNGTGFNLEEHTHHGLGLQNIIKRTSIIGGNATIKSKPNEGTTITLNIPYD